MKMKYDEEKTMHKAFLILRRNGYKEYEEGDDLDDEMVCAIIGGLKTEYYDYAPAWGERAFKARGNKRTIVIWDTGNSWFRGMKILNKEEDIEDEI